MAESLAERVRQRLRDEVDRLGLSQPQLGELIGWTQSKVAQKLTGRTDITLEDLEALAFGVGLAVTEVVRDRGLEFCAEMTPSELRLHQMIQSLKPAERSAIEVVVRKMADHKPNTEPERYAKLHRRK